MLSPNVIVVCATLVLVVSGLPVEHTRTGRGEKAVSVMLDRVNIDTYLKNTRAVNQQIKCVLKDGLCDAVGKEIKKLIPLVLKEEGCVECTESQTQKIKKVLNHFKSNYPDDWNSGVSKYGVDNPERFL